jgi:hypothetical protein
VNDYFNGFVSKARLKITIKKILTKLGLRTKQSCKHCGRNQSLIWAIKDNMWKKIPVKYHNKALCLECFAGLLPDDIVLKKSDFIEFARCRGGGKE